MSKYQKELICQLSFEWRNVHGRMYGGRYQDTEWFQLPAPALLSCRDIGQCTYTLSASVSSYIKLV